MAKERLETVQAGLIEDKEGNFSRRSEELAAFWG